MEKAIEVHGYAYEVGGGSYVIRVQDTTSHSPVAAAVKAFARYCRDVQEGRLANFYLETPEGELVWYAEPLAGEKEIIDLVRDDQRQCDPDLSASQAVRVARDILSVSELDPSDAASFAAYRWVLKASEDELRAALAGRR